MTTLLDTLRTRIDDAIVPLLRGEEPWRIMLLDAPDYPNVGDSAIFLGELGFLRRRFPNASIGCVSHRTYSQAVDAEIERSDILFLQGGGNFGDAWPLHQLFRNRILDRFAHKRIIHFPQSFHFTDAQTLAETQRVIAKAKNFLLLARDVNGLKFARENFPCDVILCPDMAFALGSLDAPVADVDFSCLLRTDKELLEEKAGEIRTILSSAGQSFVSGDWLENRTGVEKVHGLARFLIRRGLPAGALARHGIGVFELYANSRMRFGIGILARGRTVITDRLHGHIMATLLGRRRILFDSLDGKVRAFNDTWLAGDPGVLFLDRAQDLKGTLQQASLAA